MLRTDLHSETLDGSDATQICFPKSPRQLPMAVARSKKVPIMVKIQNEQVSVAMLLTKHSQPKMAQCKATTKTALQRSRL